MEINRDNYQKYVDKKTKNSPIVKNVIWAFCVGGLICVLGQAIFDLYLYLGLEKEDVLIHLPITLIFLASLFTGLGLYDNLAKYAGAGTIIPITGFSNSIASCAIEFKKEGFVLGMAVKMFTIAGPVLVYGIISSIIYGFIYYVMGVL